jgi:hypothetical protein
MFRKSGLGGRRRSLTAVTVAVAVLVAIGTTVIEAGGASGATGSNGTEQTFPQVTCSANVSGSTISQKQDISVWAIAPDSVAPGEVFTVSLPSIAATLPSSAQGLQIQSYSNLRTTYQVNGATVVAASGTVDGPATINGNSTPAETDVATNGILPTIPGPIPPGNLVPPNGTAQITAPSSGSITISATQVTTTEHADDDAGRNVRVDDGAEHDRADHQHDRADFEHDRADFEHDRADFEHDRADFEHHRAEHDDNDDRRRRQRCAAVRHQRLDPGPAGGEDDQFAGKGEYGEPREREGHHDGLRRRRAGYERARDERDVHLQHASRQDARGSALAELLGSRARNGRRNLELETHERDDQGRSLHRPRDVRADGE